MLIAEMFANRGRGTVEMSFDFNRVFLPSIVYETHVNYHFNYEYVLMLTFIIKHSMMMVMTRTMASSSMMIMMNFLFCWVGFILRWDFV